jgi:hypothetical protein
MSWVQPNAHKAWARSFTYRINTLKPDTLAEAKKLFLEIGDVQGVAQCSQSLDDILRMQDESMQP